MNRKFCITGLAVLVLALVFIACPDANTGPGNTPTTNVPHDITVQADIQNGRIDVDPGPGSKVMRNTPVSIYTYPDENYEVDYVRMNGADLSAAGNVYTFNMPNADAHITAAFKATSVTTAHKIYDGKPGNGGGMWDDQGNQIDQLGGFFRKGYLQTEHEWVDTETNEEFDLLEDTEAYEDGEGMEGGRAIKVAVIDVHNYYGLHLTFDPVNLNEVDGLSLYARTSYVAEGLETDREPWISQVVYGKYTIGQNEAGIWDYSIRYSGELNTGIVLTPNWQQIIVPLPERKNLECDTIMLYFNTYQVEGLEFFIDQIKFIQADEKALVSVTLPERGSIPHSRVNGTVLDTALDILTMETQIVYKIDSTTNVTMFGEDGNPDVTQFLNKFTVFYTPQYNVVSGSATVVGSGVNTAIRPGSANQSGASAPRLTATYGGVTSNPMAVDILSLTIQPAGGEVMLDDFQDNHPNPWGGNAQLPRYWGGTAGDAQCYTNDELGKYTLRCYMSNITSPSVPMNNGRMTDTWYVAGNLGLNHDLSSLTNIVVNAKMNTNMVWEFTLSSGFPGVAATLDMTDPAHPDGKKFSYSVPFIGKGLSFEDYVIPLQQFANNGVDLTCVTGFEFSTNAALNKSAEAISAWASAGDPALELASVKASN